MHVPVDAQASVYGATLMAVGPVKVELEGVVKSTWNLNRFSVVDVPSSKKKLGEPAGGAVVPSKSAGSKLASLVPLWKHCMVAAVPASIAARFRAQACGPINGPPSGKMFAER
jgi:hypothetical protein